MSVIDLETFIAAPPEICFDLMRDVRLHPETTVETDESADAGVTDGRIGLGQTVTFVGRHFGLRQRLTVEVVEFERPRLFVDEMTEGRFRRFRHTHLFEPAGGGTRMLDRLEWTSPFGLFGRVVDKVLLERHLRDLITKRNCRLKQIAEDAAGTAGRRQK